MNELIELQEWLASQCNGQREHESGIDISTIDNPGWRVSIDLNDTELEEFTFGNL